MMGSSFNSQILVDKLSRLNNSQQSIETLSHWCIFHRRNARQVVETWERRFHRSPPDQRVSFLYLANDILQNSRRKGLEFVTEFWKVLPRTLRNVLDNGDDFGKNAALRLINIWEERKVFIAHGQSLKEEFLGTKMENGVINEKSFSGSDKQPKRAGLQKIVSSYEAVYGDSVDEDSLLDRCRSAITCSEQLKNHDGNVVQIEHVEKLEGCREGLRESIDQLKAVESSRSTLVLHLRETLKEQESKLGEVRDQLQVARSRFDETNAIYERLLTNDTVLALLNEREKGSNIQIHAETVSYGSKPADDENAKNEQSSEPITLSLSHDPSSSTERVLPAEEEKRKADAAAMAEKLTASPSSAHMLRCVLSSLAQEGIKRNHTSDSSSSDGHPLHKKPKLEDPSLATHVQSTMAPLQPPLPFALHPLQNPLSPTSQVLQPSLPMMAPPLPSTSPPLQPPPPPPPRVQFDQVVGSIPLQNPLQPASLLLRPSQPMVASPMSPLPSALPPLPPTPPSQFDQNVGPTVSYIPATTIRPEYALANIHYPSVPQYPLPPSSFQNA